MPQAHRIKTEPPAIRVGIIRFFKGVLGEICFWLTVALALGMVATLATFHPADPAWTHTANVAEIHNIGRSVGAWFADVNLYFFGYPAYLLPLGVVWGGWRLFMRGALLELDAEIVLFRVLGFVVALLTACGLATLHLHASAGSMPGAGSAGGLVGEHVSRFLTQAFKFTWGNAFMVALLLAGLTLATGVSWLKLLDGIGGTVLKVIAWMGGQAKTSRTRVAPAGEGEDEQSPEQPPSSKSEVVRVNRLKTSGAVAGRAIMVRLRNVAALWRAWLQSRRVELEPENFARSADDAAAVLSETSAAAESPSPAIQPVNGGRHGARIEPVLGLPRGQERSGEVRQGPESTATIPKSPKAMLPDLTLIPVAVTAPSAGSQPAAATMPSPPPQRNPSITASAVEATWLADDKFPVRASNDSVGPEVPAQSTKERMLNSGAMPPGANMVRRVAAPAIPETGALPSLDLLDRPSAHTAGYSAETLEEMSRQVEILLKSFGVEARVVAVEPGPVITRFEVDPAPGVKVSQISNLSKDLARGLSVISVRVVEVIPGKSVIGLEIPNRHREVVYLREVLEAPVYTQSTAPLTLALGVDIGGNPVVANLAKMPHLLVAGTTGSGKSVAINAMLLSLLYKALPAEVRLILVDPKMLELSMYEDIPHLLTPVVTDMKEAANALRWCVGEMERRYRLMAALKVRNIAGFNRKVLDALEEGEGLTDPFWKPDGELSSSGIPVLQPLPFVVVVIDELADMMMIVGKKVEELIARLAQKARAAGIHLILATQRPSVDVITGLIKANIPTRVAFQVSSKVDSRTILDQMGAEQLLGHGDMLYLPPGTGLPQRVHGAFVDDQEVNRVVEFLRQTGSPNYVDDVLVEPREESETGDEGESSGRSGKTDPLYDEAVRIVTESRRASVSGVQRRLSIGYNRAARLVEEMEATGVVGPLQSNGSREVLAPPPP